MDTQGWLPKSNNMFDISNIQSAGGKRTELLEENYSIHCDQNNSKMILGHGKKIFFWRTLSNMHASFTVQCTYQCKTEICRYLCREM